MIDAYRDAEARFIQHHIDARSVECPHCKASIGQPCIWYATSTDYASHSARVRKYEKGVSRS